MTNEDPGKRTKGDSNPPLKGGEQPFILEWRASAVFKEGRSGSFAVRITGRSDLDSLTVFVAANGTELNPVRLDNLRAGQVCERAFSFAPAASGDLSVRLRVQTAQSAEDAVRTYEARNDILLSVRPSPHRDASAGASITIDAKGNSGVFRMDGASLAASAGLRTDEPSEDDAGGWTEYRPVPFDLAVDRTGRNTLVFWTSLLVVVVGLFVWWNQTQTLEAKFLSAVRSGRIGRMFEKGPAIPLDVSHWRPVKQEKDPNGLVWILYEDRTRPDNWCIATEGWTRNGSRAEGSKRTLRRLF